MINKICKKLISTHSLSLEEYISLLENITPETAALLRNTAVDLRKQVYGSKIFVRGLIEISNFCKNDCLYCGIRKSNKSCERYRLTDEEILSCCREGYALGFRTFVLQGGEDGHFTDEKLISLIKGIKKEFSDCAVTLSLGERSKESYIKLYEAGADRYLLRHETALKSHYENLHPQNMSFDNRMNCLRVLKETGYQVGCGFMVGSPFQTTESLATDLKFIEEFKPHMVGIGPFIPHKNTPFKDMPKGSLELTCLLLSIIRIISPNVLLPATTALGTLSPKGREMGIKSGANVIMPNLSPQGAKEKYTLYDNKIHSGSEGAKGIEALKKEMKQIGYEIVTDIGNSKVM